MKKIYTASLAAVVLSACGTTVRYLGESNAPTETVDVYVDPSSISRHYKVIGKGYVEYGVGASGLKNVQKKAVALARRNGADAILFQDYYVMENGTNIHSVTQTDTLHRGLSTVSNTTVRPVVSTQRDILFLKYE